tara:strand:+ start:2248 stop:2385 length:138 start_codon:yes stop_codon:yes gene_type:complete
MMGIPEPINRIKMGWLMGFEPTTLGTTSRCYVYHVVEEGVRKNQE